MSVHLPVRHSHRTSARFTALILCSDDLARPVTSLRQQGGEEFSERGPNFVVYVQYIFSGGARKILRVALPPLRSPRYGSEACSSIMAASLPAEEFAKVARGFYCRSLLRNNSMATNL